MKDQKIELLPVGDLLEKDFMVPAFQRGYRWKERQVKELLNDINDFHLTPAKKENEFYCLQPIVVSKVGDEYILIDGQQRLTTIYLILKYLDNYMAMMDAQKFNIRYATRDLSQEFLQNIDSTRKDENIDFYHIVEAYEVIEDWFTEKKGPDVVKFLTTLLDTAENANNVRIIWYEVYGDEDELIDIFTRINIGKIPLTNAELIKALFLSEQAKLKPYSDGQLRQLEIANEWDTTESELRNEDFWLFLQDTNSLYENKIELLFTLISGRDKNEDPLYTFQYFSKVLKEKDQTVEKLWGQIQSLFMKLREWYNNREYYHLIGYLIINDHSIEDLIHDSDGLSKTDFRELLINKVAEDIDLDAIEEYNYPADRMDLRNVLLLFNIISIINSKNTSLRFQFGKFKKQNWDIEHIHSVSSEIPSRRSHQNDWLEEVMNYTEDIKLKNEIKDFIKIKSDRDFDSIYNKIVKKYSENNKPKDIDNISNLTLLDSKTNRGYKNAVFPIKRSTIIQKEIEGRFIPLCTRNVFLKYYSSNVEQMSFWGKKDREDYRENLKETITQYLFKTELKNGKSN